MLKSLSGSNTNPNLTLKFTSMTIPHPTIEEFQVLLKAQSEAIENIDHRRFVASIQLEPRLKTLQWEYGNEEEFPAWVFGDFREHDIGVAYCLGGHGALGFPWGLIFLSCDTFGMSTGWYRTLNDLIFEWCYIEPDLSRSVPSPTEPKH